MRDRLVPRGLGESGLHCGSTALVTRIAAAKSEKRKAKPSPIAWSRYSLLAIRFTLLFQYLVISAMPRLKSST
jgi:hypothetical protein